MYSGVWQRVLLYEPRGVLTDSADRDGSLVLWAQCPSGAFADVRSVACEGMRARGFGGRLSVVPDASDASAMTLTWHRDVDTCPSCCPSGVDTATARFVSPEVLMEEGDGYLEVWRRIATWDTSATSGVDIHGPVAVPFTIKVGSMTWEVGRLGVHFSDESGTFREIDAKVV